jgi:catechol-2,3-dioxygenase
MPVPKPENCCTELSSGKVISPISLAHVVFRTANLQRMIDFWALFLGATVVFQNNAVAFLQYDDEHHRIAFIANPGAQPQLSGGKGAGMHHVAFTFANLADLVQAYKQRKELGVLPTWCVNHGPTTSMYYTDPGGNQIETQVDNFESPEEAAEFMQGALFAENPLGADFDLEELDRKIQSGVEESVLKEKS